MNNKTFNLLGVLVAVPLFFGLGACSSITKSRSLAEAPHSTTSPKDFASKISPFAPVTRFKTMSDGDQSERKAIYGPVDYKEPWETSSFWQAASRSTVGIVGKEFGTVDSNGNYTIQTLSKRLDICSSEQFATQNSLPFCSGALVAPDLVLTNGHCVINADECKNVKVILDFALDQKSMTQPVSPIPRAKIFQCVRVVASKNDGVVDYSILKLDRPVCDRDFFSFSNTPLKVGDSIVSVGHPLGLPRKFVDNSRVLEMSSTFFKNNIDGMGGQSGSSVFDPATGEIVGLLARSGTYLTTGSGCKRYVRCDNESKSCYATEAVLPSTFRSLIKSDVTCPSSQGLKVVRSTNYKEGLSGDLIATLFGNGFLDGSAEVIHQQGQDFSLGGIEIKIGGLLARLFVVTDTQVNFLVPNLAAGSHFLEVFKNGKIVNTTKVSVQSWAPGLYSNGGVGEGGFLVGSALYSPSRRMVSLIGADGPNEIEIDNRETIYLTVYGSGFYGKKLAELKATVDGIDSVLSYAGSVEGFEGLDQMNLILPNNLQSGDHSLEIIDPATGQSAGAYKFKTKKTDQL